MADPLPSNPDPTLPTSGANYTSCVLGFNLSAREHEMKSKTAKRLEGGTARQRKPADSLNLNGEFYRLIVGGHRFDYSPCLHIKTFRVAETYGDSVSRFKSTVSSYLQFHT